MNSTEILLKVIEYIEMTLEKCESSIIIRLAKDRVHKNSLRGPALIRLTLFHTLKIHSLTAVLNINFPVTMSPN